MVSAGNQSILGLCEIGFDSGCMEECWSSRDKEEVVAGVVVRGRDDTVKRQRVS